MTRSHEEYGTTMSTSTIVLCNPQNNCIKLNYEEMFIGKMSEDSREREIISDPYFSARKLIIKFVSKQY
jgi:hypothetical protein